MTTDNSDLRRVATEAIAAYMHHELFDIGGAVMMPFLKEQAGVIIQGVDNAIEETRKMGKARGYDQR